MNSSSYFRIISFYREFRVLLIKPPQTEKPRSGKPPRISGESRARITALACSDAPAGHVRWTLRLLADKAVELGFIDSISHNHVGELLKKTLSDRT